MKTNDILLLGAMGLAAYFFLKKEATSAIGAVTEPLQQWISPPIPELPNIGLPGIPTLPSFDVNHWLNEAQKLVTNLTPISPSIPSTAPIPALPTYEPPTQSTPATIGGIDIGQAVGDVFSILPTAPGAGPLIGGWSHWIVDEVTKFVPEFESTVTLPSTSTPEQTIAPNVGQAGQDYWVNTSDAAKRAAQYTYNITHPVTKSITSLPGSTVPPSEYAGMVCTSVVGATGNPVMFCG